MNRSKSLKDIERSIRGSGYIPGIDEVDKSRAAFAKLFLPGYDSQGVPAFKGVREAYLHFTGDNQFRGVFCPENLSLTLRASFNMSTFVYALQDVLSLYLSNVYRQYPYREEALISLKRPVKDFRTVHAVQYDYFDDLQVVDPEAQDWPQLNISKDTEVQYDTKQRGGLLLIARRVFVNDHIGIIKQMLDKIGRASRRTHARFVWNFFINNSACMDGNAWFTSGHGNLGSAALAIASLTAAITALANMTEPGSGEKIGFDLASLNWSLVVPTSMWDTAVKTNQSECYFTDNDLTTKTVNPCCELFGENNERIITCPFMTDANDWGVLRDPGEVPIIEMSYLDGNEEPVFTYSTESDLAWKQDYYAYKCIHSYGGGIIDPNGGYKAVGP